MTAYYYQYALAGYYYNTLYHSLSHPCREHNKRWYVPVAQFSASGVSSCLYSTSTSTSTRASALDMSVAGSSGDIVPSASTGSQLVVVNDGYSAPSSSGSRGRGIVRVARVRPRGSVGREPDPATVSRLDDILARSRTVVWRWRYRRLLSLGAKPKSKAKAREQRLYSQTINRCTKGKVGPKAKFAIAEPKFLPRRYTKAKAISRDLPRRYTKGRGKAKPPAADPPAIRPPPPCPTSHQDFLDPERVTSSDHAFGSAYVGIHEFQ